MVSAIAILSGLMGVCVGDALGVPVEFTSRAERDKSPVTSMQGYGTWEQPPSTWSDDSSLTFCLAESLCRGFRSIPLHNRFGNGITKVTGLREVKFLMLEIQHF